MRARQHASTRGLPGIVTYNDTESERKERDYRGHGMGAAIAYPLWASLT